jgi:hypothetical protein
MRGNLLALSLKGGLNLKSVVRIPASRGNKGTPQSDLFLIRTYPIFSTLIAAPDFTDLSCFTSSLALPQENAALLVLYRDVRMSRRTGLSGSDLALARLA